MIWIMGMGYREFRADEVHVDRPDPVTRANIRIILLLSFKFKLVIAALPCGRVSSTLTRRV